MKRQVTAALEKPAWYDRSMSHDDPIARAQERYDDIHSRVSMYSDFDLSQLEQSRQYFDLSTPELRTRPFGVLTTMVGLEIPVKLQQALKDQLDNILSILPGPTRVYRVRPHLMHWESHIIRRPDEPEPALPAADITKLFTEAVSESRAFDIIYQGFFVAPDGTIAFQGYGPTGELRSCLRKGLPFSSSRQNETGHISVARIIDPIGTEAFGKLLDLRRSSDKTVFGVLPVREVKLVKENRWYMEDYEIMGVASLAP